MNRWTVREGPPRIQQREEGSQKGQREGTALLTASPKGTHMHNGEKQPARGRGWGLSRADKLLEPNNPEQDKGALTRSLMGNLQEPD